MSNTRRTADPDDFRQERFASSSEFQRGLMGNLVARRVELLANPEDRELICELQFASWQPGGLDQLARDLIEKHPAQFLTPSILKYGFKPGQIYDAKKVQAVRSEIVGAFIAADAFDKVYDRFLLRGENSGFLSQNDPKSGTYPTQYPAAELVKCCHDYAERFLPRQLAELCLNPEVSLDTFARTCFPGIIPTLREHFAAGAAAKRECVVITELGRAVYETLEFCQQERCMVLIDGLARTGKTFSARAWVALHPGRARYVQVPSTNDDFAFYKAIAQSLGVSINLNSKAHQLRDRIEDVLLHGGLMLVLDEAHYLWPQGNFREKMPGRISWLMTALVNYNVPVALVATPQFLLTQATFERNSVWNSAQFTGRIGHYEKLPSALSEVDLKAVAKSFLPDGCDKSILALALYAKNSVKYLAAIESAVARARFNASRAGRGKVVFADVKSAISQNVIPSDKALADALAVPRRSRRVHALPTRPAPAIPLANHNSRTAAPVREAASPGQAPALPMRREIEAAA